MKNIKLCKVKTQGRWLLSKCKWKSDNW